MDNAADYLHINKALWTERTRHHINTAFYDMEAFRLGKSSLDPIVLDLLGDIAGREVLHLQCHFGQDTLSLARMGAKVTGLDFTEASIDQARSIAAELGLPAKFICSDVYDAPGQIAGPADLVFTTYGVLGWLPDMKRWAQVVSGCLKAGGELLLVEFHPVVWMFSNDFSRVQYAYFNKEAILETEEYTYTDQEKTIALPSVGWNHPLSDVVTALLEAGLEITLFREFDYSPYKCFPQMDEPEPGKYRLVSMGDKLPMVYALKARKRDQ